MGSISIEPINQRQVEAEQRNLAPADQSFYVCYMGAMGYTILAVFATKELAENSLASLARRDIERSPKPMFYNSGPGRRVTDYMVRQQHDLDKLSKVLRDGRNEATAAYNETRGL